MGAGAVVAAARAGGAATGAGLTTAVAGGVEAGVLVITGFDTGESASPVGAGTVAAGLVIGGAGDAVVADGTGDPPSATGDAPAGGEDVADWGGAAEATAGVGGILARTDSDVLTLR